MRQFAAIACLVVLAGACSDDAGSGGDGGPRDGGADGGNLCNGVTHEGALVEATQVAENRPAAAGGELADGVYVRVAHTIYTGPGGETGGTGQFVRETQLYAGATMRAAIDDATASFTYSTTGSNISFAISCPAGVPTLPATEFTANGATLTLFGPDFAIVYERSE